MRNKKPKCFWAMKTFAQIRKTVPWVIPCCARFAGRVRIQQAYVEWVPMRWQDTPNDLAGDIFMSQMRKPHCEG